MIAQLRLGLEPIAREVLQSMLAAYRDAMMFPLHLYQHLVQGNPRRVTRLYSPIILG